MKKKIISNTILFVFILAYILIFKSIFGDENILIAVMSITGLLMFLGRDLTAEPIKNTFWLVSFNLIIGIGSYIAMLNPWIGIPINFLVIFAISYSFCHTLKSPMYLPFTLCYLFLLAYPVGIKELPLRLLALVVGALSIMIPQFIINKNKIQNSSNKILKNIIDLNLQKIELIKNGKDFSEVNLNLSKMGKTLKNIVHDKKERGFYLVKEGRLSLDILASIEKLSLSIEKIGPKKEKEFLNYIEEFLKCLKEYKKNSSDDKFKLILDEIKEKYSDTLDEEVMQSIGIIMILEYKTRIAEKEIKDEKAKRNLSEDVYGLKNIKVNSIKIKYGLRLGICVCISAFIMEYFKLEEGRWIIFTVLSLTNPIFEVTKTKFVDRLFATIVGAILVCVLFYIFRDTSARGMVIMIAGYISMYLNTYRTKTICVTISAIGAISIMQGAVIFSFTRIEFVILGSIIALVINAFLFKCNVDRANEDLFNASNTLIEDLINNIENLLDKENIYNYLNNIYVLTSQIEDAIQTNEELKGKTLENKNYELINKGKESIILNAFEIYKFSKNKTISDNNRNIFNNIINSIKYGKKKLSKDEVHEIIGKLDNLNDKIIGSAFIEIQKDVYTLRACNK